MKKVFFIIIIVLMVSCNKHKKNEIKTDVSIDTISCVMKDMTKANQMIKLLDKDSIEKQKMEQDYKQSILNHYNITEHDYDSCLKIYLKNPTTAQKLLDKANQ
jgi:arginine decarboxylase-like protein